MHRTTRHPRSLVRAWVVAAAALALFSCGVQGVQTEKKAATDQHPIHGVIQALDPSTKTATIKHDAIKGFMGAMTMEYPIKDDAAFSKLHVGETIDGNVFVHDTDFWVGNIKEGK